MKTNKIKLLIGALLGISMVFGVGLGLSKSHKVSVPQVVLADGEEEVGSAAPEESTGDSEDKDDSVSSDDAGTSDTTEPSSDASSAGEESAIEESSEETEEKEESSSVGIGDVFKAIAKAFRDAFKDLAEHVKKWFKL